MPVSLKISAGFFKREEFFPWNPETGEFALQALAGRKSRADRFVSLWNRSSRRTHLFVSPGASIDGLIALKHSLSGDVYLISETVEREFDYGISDAYDLLLRAHKVTLPSGGVCWHRPIRVEGSGDDLGPVVVGAPLRGWADIELRTAAEPEGSRLVAVGEYLITYSRNLRIADDDVIEVAGTSYLALEPFPDSGFMSVRARQEVPKYRTAVFWLPSTAMAFDPATGVVTGARGSAREVSCFVDTSAQSGDVTETQVQSVLKLFIYKKFIGFVPKLGQELEYEGAAYRVVKVASSLDDKQFEVEATL